MSRKEKLRELAEQEQALMREIYGFDAGVKWAEERIIKLLVDHWNKTTFDGNREADGFWMAMELIKNVTERMHGEKSPNGYKGETE